MTTLTFCGAAGTVTGSCSYLESEVARFLVDCGLFQGNKTTQELNYQPFPFDPGAAEFLLLTHAHIDHSGLLPKLVKAGFGGAIYATSATCDLLEFMLRDSAWIQESNIDRLNKKLKRRGEPPVDPIYTMEDAEQTLMQLNPVEYETWFEPKPGVRARFWNAGHLLGSGSAEVEIRDPESENALRLLFSGDLGPEEKAFHPEPDAPAGYDYIVCESTYGDRDRDDYTLQKRRDALRDELKLALGRGGNVVIPSFAVERSQELLHDIGTLLAEGAIPDATVFLDSPLARKVTQVFIKHSGAMEDIEIPEEELFRHENFRLVESVEESKAINNVKSGGDHHLGERHVHRRPNQTSSESQHMAARIHRPVRRIPGTGNTGTYYHQRREDGSHSRTRMQSEGVDPATRKLLRTRGPDGVDRLGTGAWTGNGRTVPESRRGRSSRRHAANACRKGARRRQNLCSIV